MESDQLAGENIKDKVKRSQPAAALTDTADAANFRSALANVGAAGGCDLLILK
ncbi:hypothetical protein D3C81_351450 [compost metagenome]